MQHFIPIPGIALLLGDCAQPCTVAQCSKRTNVTVFFQGRAKRWYAVVYRTVCVVFFSRIKLFLDVLMKEILHPESQSPNGVKFHFIDIYLDELSKVGGKEVRNSGTAGRQCHETTADLTRTLALHAVPEL